MKLGRILGFTLIEIMVSLAVTAALYEAVVSGFFAKVKLEKTKAYAELHKAYAMEYSDYIQDKNSYVWSNMNNGFLVIPYTVLQADGYADNNMFVNSNFKPCALILGDTSSKTLYPLIIDVTSNGYNSNQNAIVAASDLGDYAAYYNSGDGSFTGTAGWSISNTSSYFPSGYLASCGGTAIVTNSIATNLVMAPFFVQYQSDISLNRAISSSSFLSGDANNTNTLQTDIFLGYPTNLITSNRYNRIFFSAESDTATKPYCASGLVESSPYSSNYALCPNSSVVTDALLGSNDNNYSEGTACSSNQVGLLLRESSSSSSARSNLICAYSPTMCSYLSGASNSYCFLSTVSRTATYTFSTTSPVTTSSSCPTATPFAIAARSNRAVLVISYCDRQNLNKTSCPGGNTIADVSIFSDTESGTNLLTESTVVTPAGNATVYVGAASSLATVDSTISDPYVRCSFVCSKLGTYGVLPPPPTYNWGTLACACATDAVPSQRINVTSIDYSTTSGGGYQGAGTGTTLGLRYLVCSNRAVRVQ